MEAILSSIITGAVVMGLVGLIFRMKSKELDGKVSKDVYDVDRKNTDDKFDVLFTKFDNMLEKVNDIHTDVVIIKKGVNGG